GAATRVCTVVFSFDQLSTHSEIKTYCTSVCWRDVINNQFGGVALKTKVFNLCCIRPFWTIKLMTNHCPRHQFIFLNLPVSLCPVQLNPSSHSSIKKVRLFAILPPTEGFQLRV